MDKTETGRRVGNDSYDLVYHICITESGHEPEKWVHSNLNLQISICLAS